MLLENEKNKLNPIGIFDSGIGGLSIWKELKTLLPNESLIYYADSANCPYGPMPEQKIIEVSVKIVDFLLSKKCKMIVVACNSATAAAIEYLRKQYTVPFIGIEPAIKPAAYNSKTGNIGVLATENTLKGGHFTNTSKKYANDINVHIQVGTGLVDCVESGKINSDECRSILEKYIKPMIKKNIDKLVLGCTHYPFLISVIEEIIGKDIEIIDPALPVSIHSKNQLSGLNLLNDSKNVPEYQFFTSGDEKIFKNQLSIILN